MQTLYSLIFFKDDQPLSCRIVRMEISDLPQILAFQQEIYQNLPDKDILFPLPQEDWEYLMNHGFTLAVFPEESDRLAYLIGCLYPKREENLGLDVGLRDDELDQVGQLEIAMASPIFAATTCTAGCVRSASTCLSRMVAPGLFCPPSPRATCPA